MLNGLATPEGFIFTSSTNTNRATELTAEQLAGSINRNTTANVNATPTRPRRTRRARRTPSQISTTSLPAYMKEPGELELVIVRGPMDMQDVPQPAATVMPSVNEDNEEMPPRDQSIEYPPEPHSPDNMPFLQDSIADLNLHQMPTNSPDPRGEAPSYDEALRALSRQSPPLTEVNLNDPPLNLERHRPQRTSGFRSILNSMNPTRLSYHSPTNNIRRGHQRNDSENSVDSSADSRPQSASGSSHRQSPSTSSFFRTLSRQRSIRTINSNHLTSPSVISINSISSPLTHTALRTEFTYPRTGPTPEQFRLISSPDALVRFGVPYGADAIAFAASASRQDLEPPPPDFDAASSMTNLTRPGGPTSEVTSAVPPLPETTPPTRLNTQTEMFARTELDVIPQSAVATQDGHTEEAQDADADSPSTPVDGNKSVSSRYSLPPLPPSSFRSPTEFGVRSESRVSSYSIQSYATAVESVSAHGVRPQEPDATVSSSHTIPNSGNNQHTTQAAVNSDSS
ncbi:hypothetical protein F5887DRAFT_874442 [Amanita rubescens]|nr:hypothetical protein F5887DRAFT_874442 [Amanita rubescens]